MQNIIHKNVKDIRPDKNQPRRYVSDKKIKELAISIKNEGIINPIEIDENGVIITGERRWRASVVAKLETIPCRILSITSEQRFIRQMHENVHHNTLNAIDAGEGLKKTIQILKKESPETEITHRMLFNLYGKSTFWIYEHLKLLREPENVKQAIIHGLSHAKIREANKVPIEYRDNLKEKIIEQQYIPTNGVSEISSGLRRAILFKDDKAIRNILSESYKNKENKPMNSREISQKIREISPDMASIIESDIERAKAISKKIQELEKILNENPLSSLKDPFSKQSLIFQINTLFDKTQKYLSNSKKVKNIKLIK